MMKGTPLTTQQIDDMDYSPMVLRKVFGQKYQVGYSRHTVHQNIYPTKTANIKKHIEK